MFLLSGVSSMLGGGAAAGAAATAGAASTGLSISSILQGVASVGGLVASISAGNAEAENLRQQANDANREKPFEVVQNVDRKRNMLKAASEAVGDINTAYAASGTDLSFGSAVEARKAVFRETDLNQTTDNATTTMRLDRLTERARNFRRMAKRVKSAAFLQDFTGLASNLASIGQQA
jgi:hypothetical protein